MKVTNKQLLESVEALRVLNGQKLPVKISYKVAKNSRVINEGLKDYTETLKKLQEDHSEKDEDDKPKVEGNRFVMKDQEDFNKAYEELLELEAELSVKPIKLDDLGTIELPPSVLMSLEWLIQE